MATIKLIVKRYNINNVIVGAWMSNSTMSKIGVSIGDFVYIAVGITGATSTRAKIIGDLPNGFNNNEILLTDDRIFDGNLKENMIAKVWKHDNWN